MDFTLSKRQVTRLRTGMSNSCSLLKTLANEDRFLILCQLSQGEWNVGELETLIGVCQPTLSQQLGILRGEGLVKARREGKYMYYRIASHEIIRIMKTLSTLC
ncbi:ArsR/SmtB family transcription factor [Pseudomonas fluorescens]|uniref:ArsR/SmtB family transcription factor n=1 Tax=Pseudomonas fluorescens TaxID=294 RepID=UPI001BEBB361|nr:metalloregulator ArsR/SmtB family transcription factor [Pseudomonas fluorescens]MBT2375377.1 helix-turn-helix transcriptional regulator [Pseudomonas fluorescens]